MMGNFTIHVTTILFVVLHFVLIIVIYHRDNSEALKFVELCCFTVEKIMFISCFTGKMHFVVDFT